MEKIYKHKIISEKKNDEYRSKSPINHMKINIKKKKVNKKIRVFAQNPNMADSAA